MATSCTKYKRAGYAEACRSVAGPLAQACGQPVHDRGFGWRHHRLAAKEMTAKGDTKAVKSKEEKPRSDGLVAPGPGYLEYADSGPTDGAGL